MGLCYVESLGKKFSECEVMELVWDSVKCDIWYLRNWTFRVILPTFTRTLSIVTHLQNEHFVCHWGRKQVQYSQKRSVCFEYLWQWKNSLWMFVILLMQNRCQIVYVGVQLPEFNNRMHRHFVAYSIRRLINVLKTTGYVMHQQFNIQHLYALPTLYFCVLYLSENKQRLVPLTALTDWFL